MEKDFIGFLDLYKE